jgi:hypothetical protein
MTVSLDYINAALKDPALAEGETMRFLSAIHDYYGPNEAMQKRIREALTPSPVIQGPVKL